MKSVRVSTLLRLGVAALLAAPVALGVLPAGPGANAALDGLTPFEIDANTVPEAPTNLDWTNKDNVTVENDMNYTGPATVVTDVGSATTVPPFVADCPNTTDTRFDPGTKIDDPDWTGDTGTGEQVNQKSDLCQTYFSYDVTADGHIIAYIGVTRSDINGDASWFFLLSRGPDPDVRVDGDIVIEVDYTGQGAPNDLGFYVWEGTPPVLSDYIAVLDGGVPVADAPELANFFDVSPVEYFGEIAIDLTGLGLAPDVDDIDTPEECAAFGYARAISRTGNGKTATLKDDGEPARIEVQVCGSITIRKEITSAVPSDETFNATLQLPAGVTLPGADSIDLLVEGGDVASDDVVFADVPVGEGGTFTLVENLSPEQDVSWDLVDIVCENSNGTTSDGTFELAAQESVVCVITNDPAPARVNVTKEFEVLGDGGDLQFTITLTGQPSQQIGEGDTASFIDIPAGTYTVGEIDPPNEPGQVPFDVVSFECEVSGQIIQATGGEVEVTLEPGDVADCIVVNRLIPGPEIAITKTATPDNFDEPEGDVTYDLVISNPGTEALEITALIDDVELNGGAAGTLDLSLNAPPGSPAGGTVTANTCDDLIGDVLAAGASVPCSFTVSYTGRNGDDVVDDTVTVTGVDVFDRPVQASDVATVTVNDVLPTITVDKVVAPGTLPESGGDATYTVTVTNTSIETLTLTSLVDDQFGNLDGQGICDVPQVLAANGGTYICSFTEALAQPSGTSHVNVVTATAEDDEENEATDSDDATVTFTDVVPTIEVTKTANPTSVPETGGDVTYTVVVENTSQEIIDITSLVDDKFGDLDGQGTCDLTDPDAQGLAFGETYTCTFTESLAQNAGTSHVNVVTATAEDDEENEATDSDDATVTFTDVLPTIEVTKTANPTSVPETGGDVTYTVVVENTSQEIVDITSLVDDKFGDLDGQGTCDLTDPDAQGLAFGDTYTCTFTKTVAQVGSETSHTNVVTATGEDDEGNEDTDDDDAVVTFVLIPPTVTIDKDDNGASVNAPGGAVTYDLEIRNTSAETVTITSLTDVITYPGQPAGAPIDLLGALAAPLTANTCPAAIAAAGPLSPDELVSCSFTVQLTGTGGTVNDVVNVVVTDNDGQTGSDDDPESTPINPLADLAIVKSASVATAERGTTFNWVLDVVNNGPSPAVNAVVSDTVPAPLVVTGVSSAQLSCSNTGNAVTCTKASMAVGETAQITVAVSVPVDAAAGPITNVGSVQATTPDPNLTNNSDDAVVTVPPVAVQPPPPVVLPRTGSDTITTIVRLGVLLIGVGAAVLLASRRRRLPGTP